MGEMQIQNAAAMLMAYLVDDFIEDDEDNDPNWVKVTVNIEEYRVMGDPSFKRHFRFTKPLFEVLCEVIGNFMVESRILQRNRRPVPYMLLMVLWIMANPDTFRSVALRFGVHPGEVHRHYKCILIVLRQIGPRYIKWPDQQERNLIKGNLAQISGFPGIVGLLDGSHIAISGPLQEPAAYRDRHHGFSIKVQAVCDDRLLVRDLYVGEAGSLHDARVFRRSPLCWNLLQNPAMMGVDEHILGDSAYMLLDKVMIPFENNGHLQPIQRNYNRLLSKVRVMIEQTFGRCKGLWRRLRYLHVKNMDYAVDHVVGSFVLHNFKILNGEEVPMVVVRNEDLQLLEDCAVVIPGNDNGPQQGVVDFIPDPYVPQGNLADLLQRSAVLGEQKRWDICNQLPMVIGVGE